MNWLKKASKLKKLIDDLEEALDIEVLSDIEHEQWSGWSKAVADEVDPGHKAKWEDLWIDYEKLPEVEKEKDREEARKILEPVEKILDRIKEEVKE